MPTVLPVNCPHDVYRRHGPDGWTCEACGDRMLTAKSVGLTTAAAASSPTTNCPHGWGRLSACPACESERLGITPDTSHEDAAFRRRDVASNCPHSERVAVRFDLVDGPEGTLRVVHQGMRCLACGDVKPIEVLLEEDRIRFAQVAVPCPHGVGPYDRGPCFTCIAATLLEGKKARELVHALATCMHVRPDSEETSSHGVFRQWCGSCGAKRLFVRGMHAPWHLPTVLHLAKALDAGPASSGSASEPPTADSTSKKSS